MKSVVRLTDRPDMILDVYRGCKTTMQPTNQPGHKEIEGNEIADGQAKEAAREMSALCTIYRL